MQAFMTTTPQEDLRYAAEDIQQAMAAGLDNFKAFAGKLSELLPGIVRAFQNADTTSKYEKFPPLKAPQSAFLNLVSQHTYLELREIKAYVPQGYQGTFLQGLQVLGEAVNRCGRLQAQVLQPYLTFLAPLLSSSEALKRPEDEAAFFKKLNDERTDFYARHKQLFAQRTETRVKVGQVIERNADWQEVLQTLNRVSDEMDSIKRDEIDLHVKHIEDYLKIIEARLKDGLIPDVSPEVSQGLAEGAYTIACELEFFGMVYYWVLALKTAIDDTVEEIARVLR